MRSIFFLLALSLTAQTRQIVITIDDLPRGGDDSAATDLASIRAMTAKLLRPLKGTKAIGFVNPGSGSAVNMGDAGLQEILKMWLAHGLDLGNHSHTHQNINQVKLEDYTADIIQAEPALKKARGARSTYYRHPYLHKGQDEPTKLGIAEFLNTHGYLEAPVTIDNSDWIFAAVYAASLKRDPAQAKQIQKTYLQYMETMCAFFEQRGKEVVGEDFPQILLLHANQLNADTMPALLTMIRSRGYKFISLEQALRHPAYKLKDGYIGPTGLSWIHRWAAAKGLPMTGEPGEPKYILELHKNRAR